MEVLSKCHGSVSLRFLEYDSENNISHQVSEAVVRRCSVERVFLRFHKIHRKTPVSEPLF